MHRFLTQSHEKVLLLFFGMTPLFLVTIRGWSNIVLILGFIVSLGFLFFDKNNLNKTPLLMLEKIVILTLMAPVFAILLASSLRGKINLANYDSASRLFIASAIFLLAFRKKLNFVKILQYTVPASLILTLLHQLLIPQPHKWGFERMATYFADPLIFGYTSLTFSLMCLTSINLLNKDSKLIVAFKVLGAITGFYLSIMSGSRTGWMAVPLIIAILLYSRQTTGKMQIKFIVFSMAMAIGIAVTLFFASSTINSRVQLAAQEIIGYSWSGMAPDTSVGMRITFLRMAMDLISEHPVMGYGDTRLAGMILPAHIYTYASPTSIHMALNSGFHNELVTNAVRDGLAAMFTAFMLFAVPIYIFIKKFQSHCRVQRANSLIGIVFVLCIFISSLSTEVFDLKYMASFYALMISLLCASTLSTHPQSPSGDGEHSLT